MSPESNFDEEDYEDYKQQVLKEIEEEVKGNNPVKQRLRLVEFMSRSAGHGRRRKRSREVILLVVDNKYAHIIKHGEVKSRRNRDFIQIDVLANEVLAYLPPEERTVDKLLEILSE